MPHAAARARLRLDAAAPSPALARALRGLLLFGAVLSLLFPATSSEWLGALPLWLVGMPASALWALHRCPLPRFASVARTPKAGRRRRGRVQARKRVQPVQPRTVPRAA